MKCLNESGVFSSGKQSSFKITYKCCLFFHTMRSDNNVGQGTPVQILLVTRDVLQVGLLVFACVLRMCSVVITCGVAGIRSEESARGRGGGGGLWPATKIHPFLLKITLGTPWGLWRPRAHLKIVMCGCILWLNINKIQTILLFLNLFKSKRSGCHFVHNLKK